MQVDLIHHVIRKRRYPSHVYTLYLQICQYVIIHIVTVNNIQNVVSADIAANYAIQFHFLYLIYQVI